MKSKFDFKSITPKGDVSWYVKWVSSCFILAAMSIRGIPELTPIDLCLSVVGVIGWLWVGIIWKDRALIILNAAGLVLLLNNLITQILI